MIYERIKELVKKNGTSINALETKIGISRGSLCKIDNHKPSSEKIQKLAEELNTTVDYLLTGKEYDPYSDEITHLYAKIRNDETLVNALLKYFEMPEEKKKHVIDNINMIGGV